jgi:hypothetical protein
VIQIIRPPEGFEIQETDTVKDLIEAYTAQWPRLPQFWINIKSRLAKTGHKEGNPVTRGRLFVEEGDPENGLPRIKVAYWILGRRCISAWSASAKTRATLTKPTNPTAAITPRIDGSPAERLAD